MKTYVEFRSDRFPPEEGEQEQINPGIYGKRLADFLVAGLRRRGFETGEPFAEDWGWIVPIKGEPPKLWIGCGNYAEYPDGFLCFLEPHELVGGRMEALQQALDMLLSEDAGIRSKQWWTHQEFNNPGRA